MNKIKLWTKCLLLCLICCLLSTNVANAKEISFSGLYLELSLPDDVICLTSKVAKTDPIWQEAGILDVSKKLDELKKMGGSAILYDPQTKTSAMLVNKTSKESQKIFNLRDASDEQRQNFYDTLTSGGNETTTATISDYANGEIPFFRLVIELSGDTFQREIIYGTIFNGTMIYFDVYDSSATKYTETDETFVQSLVEGIQFTKEYTKEEYDKLTRQGLTRVAILLVVLIALFVGLVFLNRKRKANKANQKKQFAQALFHYYEDKKNKEENGTKQKLLFTNHTTYSPQVVRDFCFYNVYWRKLPQLITTITLYALLLIYIFINSGLTILFILVTILFIGLLYFQYYRVEKMSDNSWKTYAKSNNKVAEFHFYEDYFTLSGIQYLTEFPYLQITDVRCHNGFIYLYTGNDRGIFISVDGFEEDAQEFLNFLRNYLAAARETYLK